MTIGYKPRKTFILKTNEDKMDEETALTICEEKGYLNEKGLKQLLRYAKKIIVSYDKRIKEVVDEKGLHNNGSFTLKRRNCRKR